MKLQNISISLLAAILMVITKIKCEETNPSAEEVKPGVVRAVNSDSVDADESLLEPRDLKQMWKEHWKNGGIDIYSPSFPMEGRLRNRLNWYINVERDSVTGSMTKSSASRLQFMSVGFGYVLIKGSKNKKFICMDGDTGDVYVSEKRALECVFQETISPRRYMLYRNHKYGWYLAMDEDGDVINGKESNNERAKSANFIVVK